MNYLVIVNKSNLIDDNYFKDLELVECSNVFSETIKVEKETYDAYLKLKEFLKTKNIFIELDSAYRSIEDQQKIIDDYTIKYGTSYVSKYVAPVKSSEHHTGLALDLALIIDGKVLTENDDLLANENIYLEIHKYLSNFGFILRYPKGKESITGYSYEPWHIRYVGIEFAKQISSKNLTLEEYVNKNNIVLTSCGFRDDNLKNKFYEIISKEELKNKKVLYITTAIDGEKDNNKDWVIKEYKTILDLGIDESNITEYKIGNDINIDNFDIIYMMGGNTIYLLDMVRKYNFGEVIKDFINKGKIYIGSSAGSQILGSTISLNATYEDNFVNMTDFTALGIINKEIVPHANKKEDLIKNINKEDLLLLYDGDGIII